MSHRLKSTTYLQETHVGVEYLPRIGHIDHLSTRDTRGSGIPTENRTIGKPPCEMAPTRARATRRCEAMRCYDAKHSDNDLSFCYEFALVTEARFGKLDNERRETWKARVP
jgi:hypothetical protein